MAVHVLSTIALIWLSRWWPPVLIGLLVVAGSLRYDWCRLAATRSPMTLKCLMHLQGDALLTTAAHREVRCRLHGTWMTADWIVLQLTYASPVGLWRGRPLPLILHRRQFSRDGYASLRRWLKAHSRPLPDAMRR